MPSSIQVTANRYPCSSDCCSVSKTQSGGVTSVLVTSADFLSIDTTTDGRHWTAAPAAGPTGVVEDLASDGTRIVAVGSPLEGGSGFAIWIGTATP